MICTCCTYYFSVYCIAEVYCMKVSFRVLILYVYRRVTQDWQFVLYFFRMDMELNPAFKLHAYLYFMLSYVYNLACFKVLCSCVTMPCHCTSCPMLIIWLNFRWWDVLRYVQSEACWSSTIWSLWQGKNVRNLLNFWWHWKSYFGV